MTQSTKKGIAVLGFALIAMLIFFVIGALVIAIPGVGDKKAPTDTPASSSCPNPIDYPMEIFGNLIVEDGSNWFGVEPQIREAQVYIRPVLAALEPFDYKVQLFDSSGTLLDTYTNTAHLPDNVKTKEVPFILRGFTIADKNCDGTPDPARFTIKAVLTETGDTTFNGISVKERSVVVTSGRVV